MALIDDDGPVHVSRGLAESISTMDEKFQRATGWKLIERNKAITARNRMMADVGVSLGIPYTEMPLITAEECA